jgi:hypothetical protein
MSDQLPNTEGAAGVSIEAIPVVVLNSTGANVNGGAATSTPLAGTSSTSAVLGPFTPQLGRPIWVSLSGTWAGTVTVKRSVDAGATKLPLTIAGSPWAVFTGNALEQVAEDAESGALYYLDFTYTSGTLTYRVSQ